MLRYPFCQLTFLTFAPMFCRVFACGHLPLAVSGNERSCEKKREKTRLEMVPVLCFV